MMETGLLNFHDEENFATSIYDQGDFSGVDGQSSILDMMHSDLQYSSDYLNQSAAHWDSDQEQEHNGDLAVLPVAPSECSSLNSSKEDYHKSLFEWQDSLLPYQPLDPDAVDLRLDGQVIPSELPDNIFEDSFESNSSVTSSLQKSSQPGPLPTPARCSTPIPCPKESTVSSDGSLNLDMSLSGLDVNVSDIDVSALGINVSSLEIKTESGDVDVKSQAMADAIIQPDSNKSSSGKNSKTEKLTFSLPSHEAKSELNADHEFTALFGVPEGRAPFQTSENNSLMQSLPVLDVPQLPIGKLENSDVEQLHDIAMEFIKEEQEAQAWSDLPPLDCNVDLDSIDAEVPVLEAGNLESLLEQFEATLKPAPEFSQSMPASPAHFSIPSSPLSMPASPSCIVQSSLPTSGSKAPPLLSPMSSPLKVKLEPATPKKSSPANKGVSVLHQNILESLPAEIMDRIKASGRKKTIPLIPAMPSKRPSRSGTRMHAAAATLSRNKLLKLVSRKGSGGENIQFDHDYCSNDSSSNVEFVPDKLVMDIKASTKQMEWDEDKSSRKDSGLESGDVSEDSEGAAIPSGTSSGYDSSSGSRSNYNSILKPRTANQPGRNKEMLMVSVLKKVRCESLQSPLKSPAVANTPKDVLKTMDTGPPKTPLSIIKPCRSLTEIEASPKPAIKLSKPLQSSTEVPRISAKATEISAKTDETPAVGSQVVSKQLLAVPIKTAVVTLKKAEVITVKAESSENLRPSVALSAITEAIPAEVKISLPPEQPKKRKLNFEEYRNRQRAMEQKRESKVDASSPKVKTTPGNVANVNQSTPLIIKQEAVNTMKEGKEENISNPADIGTPPPVVKIEKNLEPPAIAVIKVEKHSEPVPEISVVNNTASAVKEEESSEPLSEVIIVPDENDDDSVPKPVEERRKQRQYRTRHMSTSSSEGSPTKPLIQSSRRESRPKKAAWSPSRSRTRSVSPTSSRSRSGSSNSSGSSRSSSSSNSSSSGRCSSSSIESIQSSGRGRKSRRSRKSSCSRSRSSSRGSSTSSRRSNSISSGSSRRSSSRRSSRSRRRSRSKSLRRSRRGRSRSSGRGRGRDRDRASGWKRWRRDSSRSRGSRTSRTSRASSSLRRERSRSRNRRGDSWSSYVSRSRSHSRSRSTCQQRYTSRLRSRSRARRRFCSYSSRSESRSWSRSRSRSIRSRSFSSGCDRSQTRSRSRSRNRNKTKVMRQRRGKRTERKSWRSRSPMHRNAEWSHVEKEHKREVEERRVIYVGRIPEDTTKAELKRRFEVYGPILDISLHFREHADNYGFVTFAYKVDAYEAVERGNEDPTQPHYELCFGGRRKFCRERYADLDGMACKSSLGNNIPHVNRTCEANSFDDMLRELQAKLQARKKL